MTNESRVSTSGIDSVCINTIRTLAMDAVQKANSGYPGAPMGLAAAAYVLWTWHLLHIEDGNDVAALTNAIETAKMETTKPSIIILSTHIGYGSPNRQDTADAHGSPLGVEEVRLAKKNLGWPQEAWFYVPDRALAVFRQCIERGKRQEQNWQSAFERYRKQFPELADDLMNAVTRKLPAGWDSNIPDFSDTDAIATRAASGKVLNAISEKLPSLIGGSADLAPSTNTLINSSHDFQKDSSEGRNIRFGVREHAMGAVLSGIALHGGLRPYGATFLIFSDYMRPAIRLASMMKLPVIYIFTHDSIALGEDGPTHQPVEHLVSLRAISGLTVIRPADATETAEAWRLAVKNLSGPIAVILSRQKLPVIHRDRYPSEQGLRNGAYILADTDNTPDAILIASGSEVHLALEAKDLLAERGISARVVSMPSWELFDATSQDYKDMVLPPEVNTRIAIEAGIPMGWQRYVGAADAVIGINGYGASAPGEILMEQYGFAEENVAKKVIAALKA
ncbi:MAG: transketolase [Deltaproteobacteria bacterium]|nr:transketolase [Deltaproteobacteria bacterium]